MRQSVSSSIHSRLLNRVNQSTMSRCSFAQSAFVPHPILLFTSGNRRQHRRTHENRTTRDTRCSLDPTLNRFRFGTICRLRKPVWQRICLHLRRLVLPLRSEDGIELVRAHIHRHRIGFIHERRSQCRLRVRSGAQPVRVQRCRRLLQYVSQFGGKM